MSVSRCRIEIENSLRGSGLSGKRERISDSSRRDALFRKIGLLLSYKRYTELDPSTRLQKLTECNNLLRASQIEMVRNEMAATVQR